MIRIPRPWNRTLRTCAWLIWREFRTDLRTWETPVAIAAFALTLLIIFGLALNPVERNLEQVFSGIFWLGMAFAALAALGRSFTRDREGGTLEALRMLPVDRGVIYAAKVAVVTFWLLLAGLLLTPLFFVFLHIEQRLPGGEWLLILFASVAGLVSVGALLAGLAVQARGPDVLLSLLLLPLSVPVLIAAVRLSDAVLFGGGLATAAPWFRLLAGYDIVFFVVALLLFEFVMEV